MTFTCKTIMELMKLNIFSEEEAKAVKEWFDRVASNFQDAGVLIDLNEAITDKLGGNIFIVDTVEDLKAVLSEQLHTRLVDLNPDSWSCISDTALWFFQANNNGGGPNFFVKGDAFVYLKARTDYKEIFKESSRS